MTDALSPLPPHALCLSGYLEDPIQSSITHWNKGVVPYAGFVRMFRTGREKFALGEMWGKAVRSGCQFYRYTQDPELKTILSGTVRDLISTRRSNGSISCVEVGQQPDGPGGDLWERKYVLLGLDGYYEEVERDPAVLQAMIDEADAILAQVGMPPKVRIVDSGWSPNHIESSTLLEPMLRLYRLTGRQAYLDFARYIVEVEGGAKGANVIQEAIDNVEPYKMGGVYPKAYEMLSLFEGVVEYYRVTGDERWKTAALNLYRNVRDKEITLVGNGGGDYPYHPKVFGEAWNDMAVEQTNPDLKRMMETCVGVTWLKFCSQLLRLTGDPSLVDEIERCAYNGLLGAMKPSGDGFSYVNRLQGLKTDTKGWGATVDGVPVTCCNLNGPMGLAYLPFVAVMNGPEGPVINLFNACTAKVSAPSGQPVRLTLVTDYPKTGKVLITVDPAAAESFALRLRIPAWSTRTRVHVEGAAVSVSPGTYATLRRTWKPGDRVELDLDMRCRLIEGPHGSNRAGDYRQALIYGPVVLARDENLEADFDQPVAILSKAGVVEVVSEPPTLPGTRLQFRVPTSQGMIRMVDYASVNSWGGKRVCTWLPERITAE